jgi:hypothetical protein
VSDEPPAPLPAPSGYEQGSPALEQQLDDAVLDFLETVARRSPLLATGERKLTVVYSEGRVRRAFVELGPLRPDEVKALLAPSPPRLATVRPPA